MNKKEFKRCMQQGLGRCAVALETEENIGKYKEIVLWGCLHNLSFDTQSEGTRASYVYKLTTYFNDEEYFLKPVIEAFEKVSKKEDWLLQHYVQLLGCYANGGNETAKNALEAKYNSLFEKLTSKRRCNGYDFDRDNFERVACELVHLSDLEATIKIISDMGAVFRANPSYTGDDVCWFMITLGEKIGKKKLNSLFARESKKSQDVAVFYEAYKETVDLAKGFLGMFDDTSKTSVEDILNESNRHNITAYSRVMFARHANEEEKIEIAKAIIEEKDLNRKAKLLTVFTIPDMSFPISCKPLVEYTGSSFKKLAETSISALKHCQGEEVKNFARKLFKDEEHKMEALEMMIYNYAKGEKEYLLSLLKEIKVDYEEESNWHGIHKKILDSCHSGAKLPYEFSLYVYETTLCSDCREKAVKELGKRRKLSDSIAKECLHDSNEEIVKYVNRYLNRRKR